jgi:hypothetical protein
MTLDFHSWVVNHSVEDSENHYPRLFDDTLQWWFPDDGHTLNGVHQAATSRRGCSVDVPKTGPTIRVNGFAKKGDQINLRVN